jgi:hypothetical protein
MIQNPTKAELIFKNRLIDKKIPFQTQKIIQPYIVDFLIGKTIIELDGSSHDGREEYDEKRTAFLNKLGYSVIRIKNSEAETYSLKSFSKWAKLKIKKGESQHSKNKAKQQKERQRLRLEKEATMYEMVQLPNGDFKRVKINQ